MAWNPILLWLLIKVLVASSRYSEKACGYLAVTLLLDEEHEMMQLVINSVREDLRVKGDTLCAENQCLALAMLSNLGAGPFMEELCPLVTQLLVDKSEDFVRKKAALCLVNMNRSSKGEYVDGDDMAGDVLALLDSSTNIGLCTSVMSLVLSMAALGNRGGGWKEAPRVAISLLHKTRMNERQFAKGYTYFQLPSPWLQIKCMRLLQFFEPPEDALARKQLMAVLNEIITGTDISKKNQNKINALHAIFFEAIHLLNHICSYDTPAGGSNASPHGLQLKAVDHLGTFLTDQSLGPKNKNLKMANVRYLALDTMSRLAVIPGGADHLKPYADSFIEALKDEDHGIQRRALDVLYEMAKAPTAKRIVDHFLEYLVDAEDEVKEELVLKVAILAERFATQFEWYVDVILRLIQVAGSAVSDDIWHRVVYVVTNNEQHNPGLHKYAAGKVFGAVSKDDAHENMVKIAAYMLGEFGHHIADQSGSSYAEQLAVLQSKFATVGSPTKGIILSAYIKVRNNDPSLSPQVIEALRSCCSHVDQEVQQRACEYVMFTGLSDGNPELLPTVFEAMDFFPDRDNPLEQRLLESVTHGHESDHVLSKKREKAALLEGAADDDAREGSAGRPPTEPEPEPEPKPDAIGDLLGLDTPVPPSPPAVSTPREARKPAPPVAGEIGSPPIAGQPRDMLYAQLGQQGMAVPVMPPVFESRVTVPETVYQNAQVRNKFRVFGDAQIELGCVLQIDAPTRSATVELFAGNKSAEHTMSNFRIQVAPCAELQVVETLAAPPVFPPKKQERHLFRAQCSAPYARAPAVRVSYFVQGAERVIDFPFPLPFNKFIEGVPLAPQAFMSTWQKVQPSNGLERQDVVTPSAGIVLETIEEKMLGLGTACSGLSSQVPSDFASLFTRCRAVWHVQG